MNCAVCEASEARRELRPGDRPDPGRGRDGDGEGEGDRYWLDGFFLLSLGGVDTAGCTGWGLGRGGGTVSSTGMRRQQQKTASFFGFGRVVLLGRWCCFRRPDPCCCLGGFSDCVWRRPRRSAKVSMLVRCSRIGVWDILGPGLDFAEALAWSLCCQQYRVSSAGSSSRMLVGFRRELAEGAAAFASGRLHGLPLEVMPRHVVNGFLESVRPSRDSGVFAKKGITARRTRPGSR
jgi:hypothetical protein